MQLLSGLWLQVYKTQAHKVSSGTLEAIQLTEAANVIETMKATYSQH